MIVKLARLTRDEEAQLREALDELDLPNRSRITNLIHPGPLLGGAIGGFAGSELGDLVFRATNSATQSNTPRLNFLGRLGKNTLRAGLGAVGAVTGGLVVSKYRDYKKRQV